jgi:hypothetical protein
VKALRFGPVWQDPRYSCPNTNDPAPRTPESTSSPGGTQAKPNNAVKRLNALGYEVSLTSAAAA